MNYTVRFDRGNRGWTCSVYPMDGSGFKAGTAVAAGSGTTQQAAKEDALSLSVDLEIRAALKNADPTRPHWVQGAAGEKREAERRAEASRVFQRIRTQRLASAR